MLRITLIGATGRMGKAIRALVADDPEISITNLCVYDGHQDIGAIQPIENLPLVPFDAKACVNTDVVVDFSLPATLPYNLRTASENKCPILLGMTGLSKAEHDEMVSSAIHIPVFWAPNISFGIAVLRHLVIEAAKILPAEYDIEIVEMHHRHKIDNPSGTALALGSAVAEARGLDHQHVAVMNRLELAEKRKQDSIGYACLRGGGIVGDHSVLLTNDYEQITLSHRSLDRRLFALGALRAVKWLVHQPEGLYEMNDMVKGLLQPSAIATP